MMLSAIAQVILAHARAARSLHGHPDKLLHLDTPDEECSSEVSEPELLVNLACRTSISAYLLQRGNFVSCVHDKPVSARIAR